MRFLLDTHLLVWLLTDDKRLSEEVRGLVTDKSYAVFASTVSIWEVAIKWTLRRGTPNDMPFPASVFSEGLTAAAFPVLSSAPPHAVALEDLPPLHGDPFDRLLLATARAEGMALVTSDKTLAKYGAGVRLI